MRYSQFLSDLIRNYNYDPDSLAGGYSLVSETKENFTQRYRDNEQPMIFEATANGIFWVIQEGDSTYWLFPQAKLKIDKSNYRALQILFECRGYQDDYPTGFKLIKPAKVLLIEGTEQFEHETQGILEFTENSADRTLGKRLIDVETNLVEIQNFLTQNTQNYIRQETPLFLPFIEEKLTHLSQKIEALPEQIMQEVYQLLEERLKLIEAKINQTNHDEEPGIRSERDLIDQEINELPEQIMQEVSQLLEERLKPIEAKINQINQIFENQNNNEKANNYDSDLSEQTTELSSFAQTMIKEFNAKKDDFVRSYQSNGIYQSNLITLSITKESFASTYKQETQTSAKSSQFQDDKDGIFWAIEDPNSNKYFLVLNQERLTPQEFKYLEFSLKHINLVFDIRKEFEKKKHRGVKIICPAIAVKKQPGGSEQLELKVKGELEFY